MEKKIVLIDGYSFVFRAYHSMPPLTRNDGQQIGAVYGFTSMLIKVVENLKATHVAVILDSGSKTFRHDLYNLYKANRTEAPEELKTQFPIIREACKALNLISLEQNGFEADDLIATLARDAYRQNFEVDIISSDKDLMQLVNDKIYIYDPMKDKKIGKEEVFEKYQVYPEKIVDLLSLIGDTSDNVPGVPSIGPKTAALLLTEFGTLENIYDNLSSITQDKRRKALEENKDKAFLSKELVTLRDDLNIEIELQDLGIKPINSQILAEFCQQQGFKSILSRLSIKTPHIVVKAEAPKRELTQAKYLNSQQEIDLYLDRCLNNIGDLLILNQKNLIFLKFNEEEAVYFELDKSNEKLKKILEVNYINKISDDVKSLMHNLTKSFGELKITPYTDLAVLIYSLEGKTNIRNINDIISLEGEAEKEISYATAINQMREIYLDKKSQLISQRKYNLFYEIDNPLVEILFHIEQNGFKIDENILQNVKNDLSKELESLENKIFSITQEDFNLASPKQLSYILFEKLNLPTAKKSKKTGDYSTGQDVLEELSLQGYEIADLIIKWRQFYKLIHTYTDNLVQHMDKSDHRLRTEFLQNQTSTGRLSSKNPNLQNIPIRTEEGMKIRSAFICEPGYQLVSLDYSQIELRLFAHIADIHELKEAFKHNKDIHKITASQIFGINEEAVDDNERRKAKAINFGILYGISAFGLAKQLKIDRKEAGFFIERYFKTYPGIKKYMDDIIEYAKKHGYVETIFGRKCLVPDINNKNYTLRSLSERAALNAPIQGSQADLIRIAMNKIDKILANYPKDSVKLILQIHDELIFEIKEEYVQKISPIIKKEMENIMDLTVPLTVNISSGINWSKL